LVSGDDHSGGAKDGDGGRLTSAGGSATLPPVLRPTEKSDDVVVTLPGTPARAATVVVTLPGTPATATTKVASTPAVPATVVRKTLPTAAPASPILRRPKPAYPDGFEKDAAEYLQKRLGAMTEANAKALLGAALSSRPAYDDDQVVNGRISAYADPTGHFKQLELDFDQKSGQLRTVFVYPLQMTWTECRKTFGASVRATPANKGRTFYSYLNRRMDVLVDASGKVISLGMY
jgi:hypothetical protein